MIRSVLALNCGSSSLKFGLYRVSGHELTLEFEGEGEELGTGSSKFWSKAEASESKQEESLSLPDHKAALQHALELLDSKALPKPEAVGHRIVHGGAKVREHCVLSAGVMKDLEAAEAFAPLHVPPALEAIRAVQELLPAVPQAVCLDTAFHRTMPDVSRLFALPESVTAMGVQRYGFHGLSLESILPQLQSMPDRLVVAHLGGGCSVTAVRRGESIDTSMGLTPTGGMMMATRCGDLDPGIVLFLMRNGFETAEKLEQLLDHQSGLRGVSGLSGDMREVEKARAANTNADLARTMFAYSLRKTIAGMAAALEGLDLLVFTGGIGEHNSALRDEITSSLRYLGTFETMALPTMEDLRIATITVRLTSS